MKKIFKGICTLCLALVMALGLAGCGEEVSDVVFSKSFAKGNQGVFIANMDPEDPTDPNIATITNNADGTITIGKTPDTYGVYTRLGEYRKVLPKNGFIVTLEVYLDLENMEHGELMTYTVGLCNTEGAYLTETSIMVQKDGDGLNLSSPNFLKTGVGSETKLTKITEGGWYKISVSFYPNGEKLNSTLAVIDCETKEVVHTSTWEPHDNGAYDIELSEVGGNRYAWINQVSIEDGLKIKSIELRNIK